MSATLYGYFTHAIYRNWPIQSSDQTQLCAGPLLEVLRTIVLDKDRLLFLYETYDARAGRVRCHCLPVLSDCLLIVYLSGPYTHPLISSTSAVFVT